MRVGAERPASRAYFFFVVLVGGDLPATELTGPVSVEEAVADDVAVDPAAGSEPIGVFTHNC